MTEILDSGVRREFESGAVRDIAEGKGRMDLLPLAEIAEYASHRQVNAPRFTLSLMFTEMQKFVSGGDIGRLYHLIDSFISDHYSSLEDAILDLSIHYEQGAIKYAERNWERGISCHCYVDSALRHGLKLLRGDTDEPHGRAFLWNIFGLIWTVHNRPKFNDLPYLETEI